MRKSVVDSKIETTERGEVVSIEHEGDQVVSLQGVDVYQQDHLVLSQVNLSIKKGGFLYLIGKSGSGKSSLLKVIYGALPIENGEGIVSGYDLRKIKRAKLFQLRRRLGMVFQDFRLLGRSLSRGEFTFCVESHRLER